MITCICINLFWKDRQETRGLQGSFHLSYCFSFVFGELQVKEGFPWLFWVESSFHKPRDRGRMTRKPTHTFGSSALCLEGNHYNKLSFCPFQGSFPL